MAACTPTTRASSVRGTAPRRPPPAQLPTLILGAMHGGDEGPDWLAMRHNLELASSALACWLPKGALPAPDARVLFGAPTPNPPARAPLSSHDPNLFPPPPPPRPADSLAPLINLALRRGDALGVFNYSVALWEAENAIQGRYSLHQLQYLNAIIDTSAAKATHAQSAVVKRQFEKKLKAAKVRGAGQAPILCSSLKGCGAFA